MSRVKLSVGVWDALSALLAERAGFELLFLSGFAVAGTRLGEPDFGLLTQTEMLETARRVIGAVKVPVIVDGDTGHGGPLNVQRLVRELVGAGRRRRVARGPGLAQALRPHARQGSDRGRGSTCRRSAPRSTRAGALRSP